MSEELELSFNKEEADSLHAQLKERTSQFLSFDEAWAGFGGTGPLLEFVYFLTQNQTLKSRVESQIQALKDEVRMAQLNENELHLLRLVAVASAYEATLDLKVVVEHLGLSEPSRTLELFTKEYLIRVDDSGSTLTGLHTVRSNIMLERLLDDVLVSWESTAEECLPLLVEADLEVFLLHAFSRRRTEAAALLGELEGFNPKSWTGAAGILRALLWLGVRDYTDVSRSLIDQEHNGKGSGWFLKLDSDLAGIAGNVISDFWNNLPDFDGKEQLLQHVEEVRARQAPKDKAFVHAKAWLIQFDQICTLSPKHHDCVGFIQVLFWAAHLQIQHLIQPMCAQISLERTIEELPIEILSDLIYVLHFALREEFDSVFQEHRARVKSRFMRETNTFSFEDDGAIVRAHFISDAAYEIKQKEDSGDDFDSPTIHEETTYRVDLLRKLFPDRLKYGSQGYGHRIGILSPGHDETQRLMDSSNFYPPWAQRINAHFRLLGDLSLRTSTWEEHAQDIFELRKDIQAWLDQLQLALNIYFRKSDVTKVVGNQLSTSAFERCKQATEIRPLLPQSAVDEWGFAGESLASSTRKDPDILSQSGRYEQSPMLRDDSDFLSESSLYEQFPAIVRHKAYVDKLHDYLRHLSNFMSQGKHVILLNFALGRAGDHQKEELLRIASENSVKTDQESLSTMNLHDSLVALRTIAN